MNRFCISIFLLLSTISGSGNSYGKGVTIAHESPYFGEEPPGLIPKLFDPKIVSPEGRFDHGSFTPDMKEFYFTRRPDKSKKREFFVIRYEKNRWSQESETDIQWPQFSADGTVMYVGKNYRERTETGWSEPKSPGAFINNMAHGRSVSSNGTYYFTVYKEKDEPDIGAIYYSRLIGGEYENPIKMSAEINSGKNIGGSIISPDESYLIWYMDREDGYGKSDMYVSFKQKDGSWLAAINMGSIINTEMQESSPQLTHDGKYLFFTRGEWKVKEDETRTYVGKRYWVDTQVIENLRPKL